jgi:hypothetical protein
MVSSAVPSQPKLNPFGKPATSVPAIPPTTRAATTVAIIAKGVRAAITARPMTMMITGQNCHTCWALSASMAPAWTASATTPAVMSVTPQKMSPVLILTVAGPPARSGHGSARGRGSSTRAPPRTNDVVSLTPSEGQP